MGARLTEIGTGLTKDNAHKTETPSFIKIYHRLKQTHKISVRPISTVDLKLNYDRITSK
jgi:hypothetical protein